MSLIPDPGPFGLRQYACGTASHWGAPSGWPCEISRPCSVASLSRTNDHPNVSDSVLNPVSRVNSRKAWNQQTIDIQFPHVVEHDHISICLLSHSCNTTDLVGHRCFVNKERVDIHRHPRELQLGISRTPHDKRPTGDQDGI